MMHISHLLIVITIVLLYCCNDVKISFPFIVLKPNVAIDVVVDDDDDDDVDVDVDDGDGGDGVDG